MYSPLSYFYSLMWSFQENHTDHCQFHSGLLPLDIYKWLLVLVQLLHLGSQNGFKSFMLRYLFHWWEVCHLLLGCCCCCCQKQKIAKQLMYLMTNLSHHKEISMFWLEITRRTLWFNYECTLFDILTKLGDIIFVGILVLCSWMDYSLPAADVRGAIILRARTNLIKRRCVRNLSADFQPPWERGHLKRGLRCPSGMSFRDVQCNTRATILFSQQRSEASVKVSSEACVVKEKQR